MRNVIKLPLLIILFLLLIILISFSISEIRLSSIESKKVSDNGNIDNPDNKIIDNQPINNDLYSLSYKDDLTSNKFINFDQPSDSDITWARESTYINRFHEGKLLNSITPLYSFYRRYFNIDTNKYLVRAETKNLSEDNETILIIGDSFVAGHSITDQNTEWPNIFSHKVNNYTKGSQFNVLSVGLSGWNFYDYLLNADQLQNIFKYKYLVFGFLPNDFYNYNISNFSKFEKSDSANWRGGFTYIKCLYGENDVIRYFSFFDKFFPRTVKEYTKRYCSKFLKIINEEKVITRNEQIEIFKNSLDNLKRDSENNNFKVIFMPLNHSQESIKYGYKPSIDPNLIGEDNKTYFTDKDVADVTELIKKSGFDIVTPYKSFKIASRENKTGWVNPIDWHPSIILSYAYADDLFNHFKKSYIKNANNKVYEPYLYPASQDIYNYITSIRPSDFFFKFTKFSDDKSKKYINLNNLGKSESMTSTTEGYSSLAVAPNHKSIREEFPPQSSLCAKINRPHAEIAFNKDYFNNFEAKIINNHPSNQIIVGSKSYDLDGNEYYSRGYILNPNESVKLLINGTLIIASLESGCPVDKPIKLPELNITLEI